LLEREVDVAASVADLRDALDGAHVLPRHARAQPLLDRRILEVKKVTRVVPHEAVPHDRAAVAAGLGFRLADQDARARMALAPPIREAEAGDARADHEDVAMPHQPSLASSFEKMRRAIAIAQP